MMTAIGHRRWAIAEGFLPAWADGPGPGRQSHETACLLNASDHEAHVEITIFFGDREPVGPYLMTVPARRTRYVRFDELTDPAPIPTGTGFASLIESDMPIVVQHTRLDSRQAENVPLPNIAFSSRE